MTVEEIFKNLATHMAHGVMFHEEMANYYDFLGLKGYRKCHEYHYWDEAWVYRKLCHYYVGHFNKLIEQEELDKKKVSIIPSRWYQYTRQDVDPSLKRESVKEGLQAWVKWESQTKDLYESMFTELMTLGQVDAAMFVKCMIQDVSHQLKKAQQYHLNKKALDYNINDIIHEQKEKHDKYKQKINSIIYTH